MNEVEDSTNIEAQFLIRKKVVEIIRAHRKDLNFKGYDIDELISDCLLNFYDVMWVVTEVFCHYMGDNEELHKIFDIIFEYYDEYLVLHIDDKFIKVNYNHKTHYYSGEFVEPKSKTVFYFE